MAVNKLFSERLEMWLKSDQPKTLADLVAVFNEKSFAVSFVVLLILPALPLPTGGVTHIFEIIAILLALEMVFGRKTIWLPKRWLKKDISAIAQRKAVNYMIAKLKWVEARSRPRYKHIVVNEAFLRLTGVLIIVFSLTAFLAPPFTGLDTLPSLAVVAISLAIIFEDLLLYLVGLVFGVVGIITVLILGSAIFNAFSLL